MRPALAALLLAGAACGARTDLGGTHAILSGGGDGGCAPEIVAKDAKGASALAVDGETVFWGTVDGLVRMRDASGAVTTLAQGTGTIDSIAVDAQYVYYAMVGSVRRVPRAGGAPADFVANAGEPTALALSSSPTLGAGALYWVDYGQGIASGSVHASGQNGGSDLIVPGLDTPGGMAADDDYVYVTASFADIGGLVYEGPLFRIDKAGHAKDTLTSNLHEPTSVVIFDKNVYYVEQTGPSGDETGGVRKISVAGGAPVTVLDTTGVLPLDVAADASGVYVTELHEMTGTLAKAKPDASADVLASTPNAVYGAVRTTPTAIYWTIAWNGSAPSDSASVRKLCK
ncbi:MAG TPA: hypothetical protein VGH28_09870 [Polyangiaceae bacterium]|jgi:hypothetical protein